MIPAAIPFPIYDIDDGIPNHPEPWHVLVNGRGFLLDQTQEYLWASVPLLRQQADNSERPSEASINPEDLWRRTIDSWHKGAGQKFYDRADSDPERFWSSKGIDPWEKGEIGLLPDTTLLRASTSSQQRLAVAGSRLYAAQGEDLAYTTDLVNWTAVSGLPSDEIIGLSSDGYTVYVTYPTDGIYTTNTGTAAGSSWATGDLSGGKWAQGRLFAWNNAALYNVTSSGALPAALLTQLNSDFTWVDVTAAGGFYYAAGYSGDKSLIFYTSVKTDGTGLEVPLEAAQLPDGEIVRAVHGYLGFLLIGSDKGLRFATVDGGLLNIGSLIEPGLGVRCFEGQGRFVWFGWTNYDDTSTGLGRLDLSVFNDAQPAYASDLMASAQGAVRSVVTFLDKRVFAVGTEGIFAESSEFVAEGTLQTGQVTFGLTENKILHFVRVRHTEDAEVGVAVQTNSWTDLLGSTGPGGYVTTFDAGKVSATQHHLELSLTGGTVQRVQVRAYPQVLRSEEIQLPLLLGGEQFDRNGSRIGRDTTDDLEFLLGLEDSGESFQVNDGLRSGTVVLEDHRWQPRHRDDEWAGTFLARCKRFPTE